MQGMGLVMRLVMGVGDGGGDGCRGWVQEMGVVMRLGMGTGDGGGDEAGDGYRRWGW